MGTYRPATEAEFRSALARPWLLCQAPSFFGTDETGIEILPDGRWSKLGSTPSGALTRLGGPANEGTWDSVDVGPQNGGPTYQASFESDDGWWNYTIPVFAGGASGLRLDNMGVFVADYTPVPPGTVIRPVPETECERPEKSYSPSSEPEFRAAVTRAWLLCGESSFFGTHEAGLEIRSDGRWFKLDWTPRGALVRLTGWGNEGAWAIQDASAMNGEPAFQLNLEIDGAGSIGTVPDLSRHGSRISKIRFDNMGVFMADYVPLPAGTAVTGS